MMWHALFYVGLFCIIGASVLGTQDTMRTIAQRYRQMVQGSARQQRTWQTKHIAVVGGVCGALCAIGVAGFVSFDGRVVVFVVASTLFGVVSSIAVTRLRDARRRTRLMAELGKLSHRMYVCASDQSDVRDIVLRASRPLRTLRPYVQQFAALWATDQRLAIQTLQREIGIPEVMPIVQALYALSRARSEDVAALLREHSSALDATLEADAQRRIENAPLWVSLAVMVPFMMCMLLFLYPWFVSVIDQLEQGF